MKYYNQETERLTLRKMNNYDIHQWMKFFIDNPLEKYLGIDITLPAETKANNWIDLQLKRYSSKDFGHLAVIDKQTGLLVGVGGLIRREIDSKKEIDIAYSIIPKFWGIGYATEISRKMKQYAIENKLSDSLISIINVEKIASNKVASKIGMQNFATTSYKGMVVNIYRTKCNF